MTYTGGCLCGALRYTARGEPAAVGKCYCRDCQKETGTGHMTFAAFPAESVTIEGAAKSYVRPGGSGADVERLFCPSCGTTILGRPKSLDTTAVIRAGTLDDSAGLAARFAVYCNRATAWDAPPGGLKIFDELPPH